MSWAPCETCKLAAGIWNFDGETKYHLSICVGDLLVVLEELGGWYRGYLYHYPSKMGIFPASYVQPIDYHMISAGEEDYIVPQIDLVALEAKESLYLWKEKLFEYFATGNRQNYIQIINYMEDVLHGRGTLVHSNVTYDKLQDMRTRLSVKIDLINNLCGLPLTARDNNGQIIDPQLTSIQNLYTTHKQRQSEIQRKVPQTGWDQKKTKEPVTSKAHHLYLVVRNISHHFPEDSEIFMFLFDGESKKPISERFLINVNKGSPEASPKTNSKPVQHYCIFTDLGSKEMHSNSLYLVCKAIRKGKMLLDDKKNVSNYPYRRPYAVGVMDLKLALDESNRQQIDDDDDYQMTYTMTLQICTTHEQDFGALHLSQIKKSGPKGGGGSKGGILMSMALKFIHGDLQQLRKDFPYLINERAVLVDKLGFPDVILPGVVRNDIYVTLEHGQFEKGSKRAERNVEVAIAVCDKSGKVVPGCIIPAAGAAPLNEYESFVYYHHNQPKWNETFKLSIPYSDIPQCHLRIGFRHVAKNEGKDKLDKTFAFSHLRIMKDDGAIFPDGTHELFVYKADNKKWHDPSVLLAVKSVKEMSIPGTIQLKDRTATRGRNFATISLEGSGQSVGRSQRETVYITTLTCSTKLTQKVEMLSLLKWRQSHKDLQSIISNVNYIDGGEIVKFLQDTLDCLFDILGENPSYGEYVFDALVSIFNLLSDERYNHFIPVLDIYITKHFSAAHAYKTLLWQFNKRLMGKETNKVLLLTFVVKSIKFLFDFVIQSYSLYSSRQSDTGFHQSLDECFDSMCTLLCSPESRFHGVHNVQAALLHNLPSIFARLSEVYSKRQLAGKLACLIDSIQNDYPSLPGEKMTFIIAIIDSDLNLLHPQDSRIALTPTIIGHMISHIENKMPDNGYRSDEPGNIGCLQCVGKVLDLLHSGEELHITYSDVESATPLLLPLLKLCMSLLETTNPLKGDSYLNLVGLLKVMSEKHYSSFLDSLKTDKRKSGEGSLQQFVSDLLQVFETSVTKSVFPHHWVYLHLTLNNILMKVLSQISKALFTSFFDEKDFIPQIWDRYFSMCKCFMTQKCLQLENYSDILRAKLIRQFGDVRITMCREVSAMWHKLESKKANFIPNWIGLFLEISLLKEERLRRVAIPLIFDVVRFERACHNNFKRVEAEVFDKMDYFVSLNYGDEAYRDLFKEIMTEHCCNDKALKESGKVFVDSVSRLIGLILDYRNVQDDNDYRGQRMGCILNLLNFYKEIEKDELYVRYIYKLAELHEHDANFTEAGLTLLLHAKTLGWTNEFVPAVPGVHKYPVETAGKRKEQLYMDAIRLLNEGKSWEYGIPLCKELANVYETQQFNYQKLAEILRTQADFFGKIITELRVENEYFVVGYYGKGFPLFLRNKVFIHRGQPYERLQAFLKRLTDEFLSAQIYMAAEAPGDDIQNSNGLYLQVRKVLPVPEERKEFANAKVKIPDKITDYYQTNDICKFRYDRPFHKGKKNPECEFATLWIERTSYTTANSFPGVINWFEVCEMKTEELNPLDIARETVSSKVNEIQKLTNEITNNPSMNVNPLSMSLKGVIDAAVMGGIANYDKIFFQPKYEQEHPDHREGVNELRKLIKQQVEVLKKALVVHCQRVPPDLKAFHEDLEMRFELFQDIVDPDRRKSQPRKPPSGATLNRPLPPTPPEATDNVPFSQPKLPHRRNTGGNPNRVSTNLETSTPTNRITRSYTTKGPRLSNYMASPDRQTSPDERSQSVSSHSARESMLSIQPDEDDECRGDYETVDFSSPPSYPAPSLPDQPNSYAVIDLGDDDDYTPVTPGAMPKRDSLRRNNPEFAPTAILHGLPKSKSPSVSPPRRRSWIEKIKQPFSGPPTQGTSPPSSPTHLAPMSFEPKHKSPSPSSVSTDEEPIFDTFDSVRAKLRESAALSVKEEIGSPPSTMKPSANNTKPSAIAKPSANTKPIANNAKPLANAKPSPNTKSNQSNVIQKPLPPPTVKSTRSDYDHLPKPIDTPKPTDVPPKPNEGVYSLAEHWEAPPTGPPISSVSQLSSLYEQSGPDRSLPPKKKLPPKPPTPFKSPTPPPQDELLADVPSSVPPPLPSKKSIKKINTVDIPSTDNGPQGGYSEMPPAIVRRDKGPAPVNRSRSQTTADRTSQPIATSTPPVPLPRKTVPSYSTTVLDNDTPSSLSSSVLSDSPFLDSPPPRPPKPSNSDPPAIPPKQEPPALPPKMKPLPKQESNYPNVPPRSNRPPLNR